MTSGYAKILDDYLDRLSAGVISEVNMAENLQVSEERYKDLELGKVEIGVWDLLVLGVNFLS